MGMGHTQGTFYFLTTPVQCTELLIQLDRQEKNSFNEVMQLEQIE